MDEHTERNVAIWLRFPTTYACLFEWWYYVIDRLCRYRIVRLDVRIVLVSCIKRKYILESTLLSNIPLRHLMD